MPNKNLSTDVIIDSREYFKRIVDGITYYQFKDKITGDLVAFTFFSSMMVSLQSRRENVFVLRCSRGIKTLFLDEEITIYHWHEEVSDSVVKDVYPEFFV